MGFFGKPQNDTGRTLVHKERLLKKINPQKIKNFGLNYDKIHYKKAAVSPFGLARRIADTIYSVKVYAGQLHYR